MCLQASGLLRFCISGLAFCFQARHAGDKPRGVGGSQAARQPGKLADLSTARGPMDGMGWLHQPGACGGPPCQLLLLCPACVAIASTMR